MSESLGKYQVQYLDGKPVNPYPPLTARAEAFDLGVKAAQQAPDPGPQSATVEEAARHVGKWLNERPNRPLDLRDVAMLVAHTQQAPAAPSTPASGGATEAVDILRTYQSNLGSCINTCDKGGRKMWKRIDAVCAALEAHISRECCSDACGWSGPQSEAVHPKHDSLTLLCPRCYETTEPVAASPTIEGESNE